MSRFLWVLLYLFSVLGCDSLCVDPIPVEDLQICEDLAKSLGIVSPPEPDPVPEDPPGDPPGGPPLHLPHGTPEFHCGEPEGFHSPANGWECTDLVDNDCDGVEDSFDPDCFGGVCSPDIGTRCMPPDICDFDLAKCLPPPPPPARVECVWGNGDQLCARCPPRQEQETCVVLNGIAQILPDQDSDGVEDDFDNCIWFNPQGAACPEGGVDSDEDFVPDSVDSCTFVQNAGDLGGLACLHHPEANCENWVIDGNHASLRWEINGFPAGWCEVSFPEAQSSIRLCGFGWILPAAEWIYHDSCLDCAGLVVPEGAMCALLSGWVEMILPDSDGDSVPDEYPQGFPRDNCPETANPDQADEDLDGIGDICEILPDAFAVFPSDAGLSDAQVD